MKNIIKISIFLGLYLFSIGCSNAQEVHPEVVKEHIEEYGFAVAVVYGLSKALQECPDTVRMVAKKIYFSYNLEDMKLKFAELVDKYETIITDADNVKGEKYIPLFEAMMKRYCWAKGVWLHDIVSNDSSSEECTGSASEALLIECALISYNPEVFFKAEEYYAFLVLAKEYENMVAAKEAREREKIRQEKIAFYRGYGRPFMFLSTPYTGSRIEGRG